MLAIVPMTLDEANAFVSEHHRHHDPVVGHKFSIGLSDGETIRGVVIVGRPVARLTDDLHAKGLLEAGEYTIEIDW